MPLTIYSLPSMVRRILRHDAKYIDDESTPWSCLSCTLLYQTMLPLCSRLELNSSPAKFESTFFLA